MINTKRYVGLSKVMAIVKETLVTKENLMNELSKEKIERIWNDMATIESISLQLDEIIALLKLSNEKSDMIYNKIGTGNGGETEPDVPIVPEIEVAPSGELLNWEYTLDDANKIVTLNKYIGSSTDITVYGKYSVGNDEYVTYIEPLETTVSSTTRYTFISDKNVNIITFKYGINTSKIKNMSYMFSGCTNLKEINGLEYFDTINVNNMISTFSMCSSLTLLDLTSFDIHNVKSINAMFQGCKNLTKILVNRDKWSVPASANLVFYECGCSEVTYVD